MRATFNQLLGNLRTYFLTGVLVTLPAILTIYAIVWIVGTVDDFVRPLMPAFLQDCWPVQCMPGIGLVVVIAVLVAVGALMANVVGKYMLNLGERVVNKMPIVRTLYGGTKQILSTMVSPQSTSFKKVVMVEFPCKGEWSIGFIANEKKSVVHDALGSEHMSVYVPTTPVPTSGYLLFVPPESVRAVDLTVEEGLKMVISVGMVARDDTSANARTKAPAKDNPPLA